MKHRGGDRLRVPRQQLRDGPGHVGAVLEQGLRRGGRGARLAPVGDFRDGPGLADKGGAEDGVRGLMFWFC